MDRRSWIKNVALGLGGGALFSKAAFAQAKNGKMIVLYCDLAVDPAREAQMLKYFHSTFKPAASKFEGFIDLKILKFEKLVQGAPPPRSINYRFQLTYQSLALQQKWVNSPTHVKLWPGMAATLLNPNDFQVLVFDNA
jgi:hypothetical protein